MCDENYAEIICSRSSAHVEGLTITRNPVWPLEGIERNREEVLCFPKQVLCENKCHNLKEVLFF